jgi:hypothetical protein
LVTVPIIVVQSSVATWHHECARIDLLPPCASVKVVDDKKKKKGNKPHPASRLAASVLFFSPPAFVKEGRRVAAPDWTIVIGTVTKILSERRF